MRMSLYVLSFFLLCLLLPSCGNKTNVQQKLELEFQKRNTVVLEQKNPLFGKFYEQIKVTSDGQYWLFADRIRNQVFVFKSDGSFHSVIGERGKGPKGILQIVGFDVNEQNELFIFDSPQRLLKVFNLKGELLHSTPFFKGENLNFKPSAFGMLWYDNQIITSVLETDHFMEPHKSKLIALMELDGSTDTLFGQYDAFGQEDNQRGLFTEITLDQNSRKIYSNLQTSPYYQVYDIKSRERIAYAGQKTNNFAIPAKEIKRNLPLSEKKKRAENTSAIRRIYLTDEYVIQHMQVLTEEWFELGEVSAKENYLVIYDKATNEFIQEMKVDNVPVGVHNNQLYMVEDLDPDNYTIGIYELVEEKGSIKEN